MARSLCSGFWRLVIFPDGSDNSSGVLKAQIPCPSRGCSGGLWHRRIATLSGGCIMRLDYSPFFRSTVGFDRLLDLLESADTREGYPPYNIERSDENHYRVTVAVAGFAEKDLGIEVRDGVLTVTGKREAEPGQTSSYL